MTLPFLGLFLLGLAMLVWGLVTVSKARAAWIARSVPAIAKVITCTPVRNPETDPFDTFRISAQYSDTRGRAHTADLPAAQQFQAGDPVDIRFDPDRPATVYLSEHFARSDLPKALIVFGGLLVLVSFFYATP